MYATAPRLPLRALDAAEPWDVLVVGGGATGLGVALEAQLRGLRVLLVERRDFASGTSSRSTKLVHGGVRYLAQGHWTLVREALRERSTVLDLAPHLAQPLAFCVPLQDPWSRLRMSLGLHLYQWMAGRRSLGPLRHMDRGSAAKQLPPGVPAPCGALQYWDGQFEDARFALALARTAQAQGADLRNHTELVGLQRSAGLWRASVQDALTQEQVQLSARAVVYATGVWVDGLRALWPGDEPGQSAIDRSGPWVTASQGVHLVVSQDTFALKQALLVPQTQDGRVLFALPWLGRVVLGTTDTPRTDAPLEPRPYEHEVELIVRQARLSLGLVLRRQDIRSVWVGLRPLVRDPAQEQATSRMHREHRIWRHAPGLHVVTGGKWTTYRQIGQEVVEHLAAEACVEPKRASSSATHRLFGAPDLGAAPVSLQQPPGLHLWGKEGAAVQALPGHDRPLGMGLSQAMVRYSARCEWAVTAEDMLARRWRALFLDALAARDMAPAVAQLLQQETGIDPQLEAFLVLCDQYRCPQGI